MPNLAYSQWVEDAFEAIDLGRRHATRAGRIPRSGAAPSWIRSLPGSNGQQTPDAKPLKGFTGGVLEVVSDHRGDTFRTVYTVRFANAVYVLHAFQKKSKQGIGTPKSEIELVKQRLKRAIEIERERKA